MSDLEKMKELFSELGIDAYVDYGSSDFARKWFFIPDYIPVSVEIEVMGSCYFFDGHGKYVGGGNLEKALFKARKE